MSVLTPPRASRTVVGLAVAALALAGTGVASAHGPSKAGPRGGSPADGQVVRSESVVRTATGFTTRLAQYGTVTSVSPTSLVVASADGVSQTWVLNSSTRYRAGRAAASNSSLAANDIVTVSGVRNASGNVAQQVEEKAPKAAPASSPTATPTVTTG